MATVATAYFIGSFHAPKNLFDLERQLPGRRYHKALDAFIMWIKFIKDGDEECKCFAGSSWRQKHQIVRGCGFFNNRFLHRIQLFNGEIL
jgi:hypothetical protein